MKNGLPDLRARKESLIRSLKSEGILYSQLVEDALRRVPREHFVWDESDRRFAYEDEPLSLDTTGQTISAPHMVVYMLEALELDPTQNILEIGCGSGYNAALIANIVQRDNSIVTVERDATLVEFARRKLAELKLDRIVNVVEGDGSLGYPQESKEELYDRIIVTAGAPHIPAFLKAELNAGGMMLIPVGPPGSQNLVKVTKKLEPSGRIAFSEEQIMPVAFVPLIGSDALYF